MFKKGIMLLVAVMVSAGVAFAGGEEVNREGIYSDVDALKSTVGMQNEAIFALGTEVNRLDVQKQDKISDSSYYAGVLGGASLFAGGEPDFKTGWAAGAFVGVDMQMFRGELEYQYLKADFKEFDSDVSVNSLMGNVYYDFMEWGMFTPYLTTGIGVGWFDMGNFDEDQTSAVAKFGGGLDVAVAEDMTIGARYVYFTALNGVDYDANVITGVFTLSF